MTMGRPGQRDVLGFKWEGRGGEVGDWGSEYVRAIAAEIGEEYESRRLADGTANVADLVGLVEAIIPFDMKHNAEVDVRLHRDRTPLR
jgi:hypothetical protein